MSELGEKSEGGNPSRDPPATHVDKPPIAPIPPLPSGYTRPQSVEADLTAWYSLDEKERQARLHEMVTGKPGMRPGALVHICTHAFEANDERLLNLAFSALSRSAANVILSNAKGVREADQRDYVQDVLEHLFNLIMDGKAHFAEVSFEGFCRRYAIDLFRKKKTRIEGKLKQQSPLADAEGESELTDPLDNVAGGGVSAEDWALINLTLDALPDKIRSVFIQYHQFDFTHEELAKKHGVSDRTIRNWLTGAAKILGQAGEKK